MPYVPQKPMFTLRQGNLKNIVIMGNRNKVSSHILVIMNNHSRLGEGLSSTFKANNNNKSSVTPRQPSTATFAQPFARAG